MKIVFLILCLMLSSFAIEVPVENDKVSEQIEMQKNKQIEIFGANLFNGEFSKSSQHRYNPDYLLNISDTINLKLWGAVELELKLTIDEQGNIFVPKVGTINLLGVKNKDLSKEIKKVLQKTYKNNVYIYANLDNFQPVSVFIAGGVEKPGLYEGLSSDSILQFLDKAKGINNRGSFRNISIIRNDSIISSVDLYKYLLNGKLDLFQFKTGDIINVEYLKGSVKVEGDVLKPLQIETKGFLTINTIAKLTQPHITATDVVVSRFDKSNQKKLTMYPITNKNIKIQANDHVKFVSNNNNTNIEINIDGEHEGLRNIVVKKGTSLKELLSKISFSTLSSKDNINLYRKSTAVLQKELLMSSLKELESSVLKTGSVTTDEAVIRKQEAALVLDFIERAKKVEPKGRVVLNKDSDLSKVILESEDKIFIPKTNHIVTVQGEVKIPSSLTFVDSLNFEDYLQLCGGLNERADRDNILVIHQNGNVTTYDDSVFSNQNLKIIPGDSILVLGKVDTKNLQIFKDITQILYQIAVGAGVLVRL
ncbi:polysaccharide biosynthesis/export family protein [Arcobacter peruensis]|uniref:polysaccharide biosynthesis/export family protein n=1 Tax=Arcobacter peruensis TaxID=2320140 RepID=UPI000F092060|nr:SLBB domain-containing protein [Arcobacter peruensis]